MATAIDSYSKFKEYCLRALGQDEDLVLKVNVTEKQLEDRIQDALEKWQDFHFEGSTLVGIHKYITAEDMRNGYLDVPTLNAIIEILEPNDSNKSNAEVMDDLEYRFHLEYADNQFFSGSGYGAGGKEMGLTDYHITMEYLATMRYLFTADKLFTYNATSHRLYLQGKYSAYFGPNLLEEFREGNWDAGTGTTLTPDIEAVASGDLIAAKIENTDSGANPIHVEFTQETNMYPRGLRTFSVQLKAGTYTGKVRLRVLDRAGTVVATNVVTPLAYWKTFEVGALYKEGHINDFVFEIESVDTQSNQHFFAYSPTGYRNNFLVLLGYETLGPDEVDVIWNSAWLKEYAIARIKWQWANNLKKFEGVQMAGGVTLNGQAMYEESMAEMEKLVTDLEERWSLPPAMMIG